METCHSRENIYKYEPENEKNNALLNCGNDGVSSVCHETQGISDVGYFESNKLFRSLF